MSQATLAQRVMTSSFYEGKKGFHLASLQGVDFCLCSLKIAVKKSEFIFVRLQCRWSDLGLDEVEKVQSFPGKSYLALLKGF